MKIYTMSDYFQTLRGRWVRHDWATSLSLFTFMHWRRKWQPTPVFLPGESRGWRSLVGCHLWGRAELDTTEATQQQQQQLCSLMLLVCSISWLKFFPICGHSWNSTLLYLSPLLSSFAEQSLWIFLPVQSGCSISYSIPLFCLSHQNMEYLVEN